MSLLWFNPYVYSGGGGETPLYSFTNFTFTNAGATGSSGPTLTQCQTAYSGQTWLTSYFDMWNQIQGYQQWTVPSTGKYFIIAAGATGGKNGARFGGMASVVFTTTTLNKSDQLILIVGQIGGFGSTTQAAGGGGGSFVIKSTNTSYPLVAAGGGGGAGNTTTQGTARMWMPGYGASIIKSTDAFPVLIRDTSVLSTAGTSFAANNGGAGYNANPGAYPLAQSFNSGFFGGTATGGGSIGGFGGGGGGALSTTYNFVGGGGGGWSGGKVTSTTGDGAYIASSNFCSVVVDSGHIWHNMYKNTDGSGDGRIGIYKFPNSNITNVDVTFTSCGVSGSTGPTYAQMISYYQSVGANLIYDYLVNYLGYGGMQVWLVPKTGTYKITATGGNGRGTTFPAAGGKGGIISANFYLKEGEPLLVVVGQIGANIAGGTTGGTGGGASWVYRMFNADLTNPLRDSVIPLIGAGGGGGAYSSSAGANVTVADTVGTASSYPTDLNGGASFLQGSQRAYGLFGHMENATTLTTAYKYPFTGLDYTIAGGFGGGGRSVIGGGTSGGGAGWRASAGATGVGAGAGTCWSANTTYVYTGALNGRADGNGEVRFELL